MNNDGNPEAMSFMMTYGWAILIVLIAVASLWYFGVLNPSAFLPKEETVNTTDVETECEHQGYIEEIYYTYNIKTGEQRRVCCNESNCRLFITNKTV